jgi:hypothetical protein
MEHIYDTHDKLRSFDFTKLLLSKPTLISGGNYFIRFKKDNFPLYIQPPRCYTRSGFIKNGRKYYTDLLFTNDDEYIIHWLEKLEEHCIQYIYENRHNWFDGEMEKPDIENYFTSPLKIYKSGKFYSVRTNIPTVLEKPSIKIYDESENIVDFMSITDTTQLMNILEVQGIKCSARSFQIEIEMKQALVITKQELPLFDKCIIQSRRQLSSTHPTPEPEPEPEPEPDYSMYSNKDDTVLPNNNQDVINMTDMTNVIKDNKYPSNNLGQFTKTTTDYENTQTMIPPVNEEFTGNIFNSENSNKIKINTNMEEFDITLEELSTDDKVVLKEPNEVYYKMYRDARMKAKMARELALSSYLEAKNIKNTYMLNNIDESDSSDLDNETESINSDNESI